MIIAVIWTSASAQRHVGPFKSEQAVYDAFDAPDGTVRKGKYAGSRVFPKAVEPPESAVTATNSTFAA